MMSGPWTNLRRLTSQFATFFMLIALTACVHVREDSAEAIRTRAVAEVERGATPGLAVATVEGRAITVDVAGVAALADGRPVEPDTAFLWFSITKLFTATAIMQLHERGELDIDAPIRDVLEDEWTLREPPGRPITARDLLCHRSGLGNPSVYDRAHPAGHAPATLAEQLADLSKAHGPRLRRRPGQRARYSNFGYLILGRMIERADPQGRDYAAYVREEILEPLGMVHTDTRWTPQMLAHGALGHSRAKSMVTSMMVRVADPGVFGPTLDEWVTTVPFELEGAPYGGLIGTADDLAIFLAAHINHGEWRGRQLLSPASVLAMQTPQTDNRGAELGYGLGWHTGRIDGERYFNHMGKGGGYRPAVRIWPARRYGVVILTNRTVYDPRPLTRSAPPRSRPKDAAG